MRHAILGVGGIGGLMGAALAKSGDAVTLVLRPESVGEHPNELSLESYLGNFSVPVEKIAAVDEPFDILWITVKATQLDSALASIKSPEKIGAIVPLLNGVDHVAMLRARFGAESVVAATIAVESERVAPGKIVHRSPFVRLNVSSSGEERLAPTLEKLRAFGFACQFMENEQTLLWSKLCFLGPFALTTSAAGMDKGEIANDMKWRGRFEACVAEACSVATASGAKVDAAQIVAFFYNAPAGMRSSMQKDIAAGNAPELDAIAGPIMRGGKSHGIEVPVTRELVAMVESKVAGR
jgi:2-dehydropantoate 2-reductase